VRRLAEVDRGDIGQVTELPPQVKSEPDQYLVGRLEPRITYRNIDQTRHAPIEHRADINPGCPST